jgi:peptidoglycan hydrolase-like protein with peptidoglycan-binding domain
MLAVSALVVAVPATAVAAQTRPAHLQVATARANAGLSRDTRLNGAVLSLGGGYGTLSGSPLVRAMQRRLVQAGYTPDGIDGIFGPRTRQAVIAFQAAHGLQQDGVVGPRTWAALKVPALILGPGAGDEARGSGDVRSLQRHLAAAGDRPGPVDGHYGPLTEAAVERFQQSHGLRVDGIAGPRMLALVARPAQPAHKSTPQPAHDSTPRPAHRSTPVSPAPRSNAAPAPANRPATTARRAPAKPSHGTRSVPWIMLFGLAFALACVLAFIVGVVSCVPRRGDGQFSPASAASGGGDPAGPERMELSPVGVDAAAMAASGAAVVRTNGHAATNGSRAHANADCATHDNDAHVEDAVATNATAATNRRGANGVVANGKGAKANDKGAKGNGTGAKANGKGAHAADPGARANGMGAHANGEGAHGNGSGATDGAAPVANEDPQDLRRTAVAAGAFNHGLLLEDQGAVDEGEAAYRRAVAEGAFNLGVLLEEQGELAEAEAAYRRAAERGDATAAFNLGVLLEERGSLTAAHAAYRRAAGRRRRRQPGPRRSPRAT